MIKRLVSHPLLLMVGIVLLSGAPASAQDRLCDPGDEDCRAILINYIRNETVGIDVAFWFMEDARYTTELIRRHQAGVRVRVLMDPRANTDYPLNASRLSELQAAGIPMRKRLGNYILHWKMMLFAGQNVVEFSGANYSANAWRPATNGALRELHRRGHLFHQRHQHHQQLSHQVRRPLGRHGVMGELREHHAAAHAAVRHLPEESDAELPAGRELPDALGQRLRG